jgi:DNA-binding transcriptional ArsR family regulator
MKILSYNDELKKEAYFMTDILHVFKSLSDRTRLRIVRLLLKRDLCVCELMFILGMAQSRVSHQLRILRDAGLVEDTRDGQWIIYRIPENARTTIAPLLGLFRESGRKTDANMEDENMLRVCLKEGVRRKKRLATKSRARPADKNNGRRAGKSAPQGRKGEKYGH